MQIMKKCTVAKSAKQPAVSQMNPLHTVENRHQLDLPE
uniref:Uncharacterized protein n=1 Tax=Anguilla anguilla TaxID=7936 RepID=A0A0E9UYT3_ANGAN